MAARMRLQRGDQAIHKFFIGMLHHDKLGHVPHNAIFPCEEDIDARQFNCQMAGRCQGKEDFQWLSDGGLWTWLEIMNVV